MFKKRLVIDKMQILKQNKFRSAIILAGGKAQRYKKKKQFEKIDNKELWKIVYDKVVDEVVEVIVVGVDIEGGATRTGSVKNGLNSLSDKSERVIILESARPFVTKEQIIQLLYDDYPSCSFSMPMVETILINKNEYIDRNKCLSFQTPQAFDTKLLKQAYATGNYNDVTDETRVMYEIHGIAPKMLLGGKNLMKVTYPGDIAILHHIINNNK